MGRVFNLTFDNITVAGATTLAMIRPSTTCSLAIIRAWVAQKANATSAQVGIHLCMQAAALPTTLTSATPVALDRGGAASAITGGTSGAAGTCGINAGTEGAGTRTILVPDCFNALNGWLWVPGPRDEIVVPASSASALALWFSTAPGTLTGWSGGLTFEER